MTSLFHDLPLINDHDKIGIANRIQPVGDTKTRPPLHKVQQRILDVPFRSGINAAGSFIQDEDFRIRNKTFAQW